MYDVPFNMKTSWSYECPITGKAFEFTRAQASRKEAFAAQQRHTAVEIQRLERAAGRRMSYRELVQTGRLEREQAEAEEASAQPQETEKPHPLFEAMVKQAFPNAC